MKGIFRAYHFTEAIKLTSLLPVFQEKPFRASGTELAYKYDKEQFVILFNFGAIVFFNIDPLKEKQILGSVLAVVQPKDEIATSEEFHFETGPKLSVEFRRVIVENATFERIEIIALVLAQSTALDYFENTVNSLIQKSSEISEILEKEGRIGRTGRELMRFIGLCLNMKQKVVSSTYILDSPEPTWEDQELSQLHHNMIEMFELRDRYKTLEYKLRMIQENVEILSDFSRSQRANALEISIVVLIAFEIVLFLYQLATFR